MLCDWCTAHGEDLSDVCPLCEVAKAKARAEKAEAEADRLRSRVEALREALERSPSLSLRQLVEVLRRDDEAAS